MPRSGIRRSASRDWTGAPLGAPRFFLSARKASFRGGPAADKEPRIGGIPLSPVPMSEPTATPVAPTGDGAPPSARPSKRRLILIGAGALPLVVGAVTLLRGRGSDAHPTARHEPGVLALDAFVVNLGDADAARFLKCTVRL